MCCVDDCGDTDGDDDDCDTDGDYAGTGEPFERCHEEPQGKQKGGCQQAHAPPASQPDASCRGVHYYSSISATSSTAMSIVN